MARHVVARVDEIQPGARKRVTVGEREVVIFNVAGAFFALLDRCPHQGGSLCDGVTTGFVSSDEPGKYDYSRPGEFVRCPWHGWHFDVRTGKSWGDPDRTYTKRYDVEVSDGRQLVEGPYQAETFEVTVDQQYIVIEA